MRTFVVGIILVFSLLSPFVGWAGSGYDNASIAEYVVQEINTFRSGPVSFADRHGILAEVQTQWGAHFDLLQTLQPLELDSALSQIAYERLNAMIQGKELPDLLERVKQVLGLKRVYALDALSYIAFENYIPPEEAVSYMLISMEINALLMKGTQSVPLVFPSFNRVGVAFTIARLSIDGVPMNVYVLYLVFADDASSGSYIEGRNYPDILKVYRSNALALVEPLIFPDGSFYAPMPPGNYTFVVGKTVFTAHIDFPLIFVF